MAPELGQGDPDPRRALPRGPARALPRGGGAVAARAAAAGDHRGGGRAGLREDHGGRHPRPGPACRGPPSTSLFADREECFQAAYQANAELVAEVMAAELERVRAGGEPDPLARLDRVLGVYLRSLRDAPALGPGVPRRGVRRRAGRDRAAARIARAVRRHRGRDPPRRDRRAGYEGQPAVRGPGLRRSGELAGHQRRRGWATPRACPPSAGRSCDWRPRSPESHRHWCFSLVGSAHQQAVTRRVAARHPGGLRCADSSGRRWRCSWRARPRVAPMGARAPAAADAPEPRVGQRHHRRRLALDHQPHPRGRHLHRQGGGQRGERPAPGPHHAAERLLPVRHHPLPGALPPARRRRRQLARSGPPAAAPSSRSPTAEPIITVMPDGGKVGWFTNWVSQSGGAQNWARLPRRPAHPVDRRQPAHDRRQERPGHRRPVDGRLRRGPLRPGPARPVRLRRAASRARSTSATPAPARWSPSRPCRTATPATPRSATRSGRSTAPGTPSTR